MLGFTSKQIKYLRTFPVLCLTLPSAQYTSRKRKECDYQSYKHVFSALMQHLSTIAAVRDSLSLFRKTSSSFSLELVGKEKALKPQRWGPKIISSGILEYYSL